MTERFADITARIDNVTQLAAVVTAMRGIAASRAQQSRSLIAGIEAYAETVSGAIGEALGFLSSDPSQSPAARDDERALILFCTEQGFAGALSDRVLDAARAETKGAHLAIVGTRGSAIAAERGFIAAWSVAMASQIGAVPDVANRIADALYARIVDGTVAACDIFYPRIDPDHTIRVVRNALFPLDLKEFRKPQAAIPPLLTLEPEKLLERLVSEYIYARLCGAAMHAFAAENHARMEAMGAASNNIDRTLVELTQRQNQVRQEEVTAEIVELTACTEIVAGR